MPLRIVRYTEDEDILQEVPFRVYKSRGFFSRLSSVQDFRRYSYNTAGAVREEVPEVVKGLDRDRGGPEIGE